MKHKLIARAKAVYPRIIDSRGKAPEQYSDHEEEG